MTEQQLTQLFDKIYGLREAAIILNRKGFPDFEQAGLLLGLDAEQVDALRASPAMLYHALVDYQNWGSLPREMVSIHCRMRRPYQAH